MENLHQPTSTELDYLSDQEIISLFNEMVFLEDRDNIINVSNYLIGKHRMIPLNHLFILFPEPSSMFQKTFFQHSQTTLKEQIFSDSISLSFYIFFYKQFFNRKFHFSRFLIPPIKELDSTTIEILLDFFQYWTNSLKDYLYTLDKIQDLQSLYLSLSEITHLFSILKKHPSNFTLLSMLSLDNFLSPEHFFVNTKIRQLVLDTFSTETPLELFNLPQIASFSLREGSYYGDWDYNTVIQKFPDHFI